METINAHKCFNENKSIEEMEFNISKYVTSLENFKFELHFYKVLLNKPIFKPQVMNLYETFAKFKNEINSLNKNTKELLNELNSHAHHIRNKIECDNIACDSFFISEQDNLDAKVFKFNIKIFNFKFRLFQYIESVIIN